MFRVAGVYQYYTLVFIFYIFSSYDISNWIYSLHGMGTVTEWSIEGKRLVSLTPRLVPQTVFTAKASHTANAVSQENSKLPPKKGSYFVIYRNSIRREGSDCIGWDHSKIRTR